MFLERVWFYCMFDFLLIFVCEVEICLCYLVFYEFFFSYIIIGIVMYILGSFGLDNVFVIN